MLSVTTNDGILNFGLFLGNVVLDCLFEAELTLTTTSGTVKPP